MHPVDLANRKDEDRPKRAIAAEVLVVGADDWAINDAMSQLRAAGRTVHRCSESAEAPFPCNALIPGRGCPLDRHHVDVVLNIRTRPEATTYPGGDGRHLRSAGRHPPGGGRNARDVWFLCVGGAGPSRWRHRGHLRSSRARSRRSLMLRRGRDTSRSA